MNMRGVSGYLIFQGLAAVLSCFSLQEMSLGNMFISRRPNKKKQVTSRDPVGSPTATIINGLRAAGFTGPSVNRQHQTSFVQAFRDWLKANIPDSV